ncbi:Phosphatidylglycerol/phosphatidylinositol transfer protein [Oopsacas minuta]|uniref:Phosphatidylglycerol/phosphatidylinositol transfer protein n=1 Tax=Oopsacas minuta TaxID=111878 RepID=A0AAV7K5C0_9METZ|nr:Phosphatidylglycerol/phosphatidylinositol transfer protein [Oopsacas minuta]
MKGGLFVLLLSVWVVLSMGKVSVIEYDVEILPAISLDAATPVNVNEVGDIWSDCGKASDEAKIVSVTITPDPPKKGQKLTVKASFGVKENVTGGTVKVQIKWGVITVLSKSYGLCDLVDEMGKMCPVAEGTIEFTKEEAIPSLSPGGGYTGKIIAGDQNGKELLCIDLKFDLS